MNENRGFGKFLAELRIKKGFEMQKDLSDKSGVSTATISRLEAGKQKPLPYAQLHKISVRPVKKIIYKLWQNSTKK